MVDFTLPEECLSAEFVHVQFQERAGTVLLPKGQNLLVTLQSRSKDKNHRRIKPESISECRGSRGFPTTHKAHTRCSVPAFDGTIFAIEWKEALWARFYTGAPRQLRQSPGSGPGQA
jgi:hypothetical protein